MHRGADLVCYRLDRQAHARALGHDPFKAHRGLDGIGNARHQSRRIHLQRSQIALNLDLTGEGWLLLVAV